MTGTLVQAPRLPLTQRLPWRPQAAVVLTVVVLAVLRAAQRWRHLQAQARALLWKWVAAVPWLLSQS